MHLLVKPMDLREDCKSLQNCITVVCLQIADKHNKPVFFITEDRTRIDLAWAVCSGSLPSNASMFPSLRALNVSGNKLSGSLPAQLGQSALFSAVRPSPLPPFAKFEDYWQE